MASPRHKKAPPPVQSPRELANARAKLAAAGIDEERLRRLLDVAGERGGRTIESTELRAQRHRATLTKILNRRRSDHAALHRIFEEDECPGIDKCAEADGLLVDDARAILALRSSVTMTFVLGPLLRHLWNPVWAKKDPFAVWPELAAVWPEEPTKTSIGRLLKRIGLTDRECALLQLVHEYGEGAGPFTEEEIIKGTDAWKTARHARNKTASKKTASKKTASKKIASKKAASKKPASSKK